MTYIRRPPSILSLTSSLTGSGSIIFREYAPRRSAAVFSQRNSENSLFS